MYHPVYTNLYIQPDGTIIGPSGKVLSTQLNPKGYHHISFKFEGKKYTKRVHRLVAETYLSEHNLPSHHRHEVNHIDFDKSNNSVDNLEWVTPSQNGMHRHGWTHNKLQQPS